MRLVHRRDRQCPVLVDSGQVAKASPICSKENGPPSAISIAVKIVVGVGTGCVGSGRGERRVQGAQAWPHRGRPPVSDEGPRASVLSGDLRPWSRAFVRALRALSPPSWGPSLKDPPRTWGGRGYLSTLNHLACARCGRYEGRRHAEQADRSDDTLRP